MEKTHFPFAEILHIVFDYFGVAGNNGTVEIIIAFFVLLMLIDDGGIENGADAFFDQRHDVAVSQFGGIAHRFGRNGFHARFEHFFVAFPGKYHSEPQLCQKCMPERIVFIHIENTGHANFAPLGFFGLKGSVAEKAFVFIIKEIGNIVFADLLAGAAFTAVP